MENLVLMVTIAERKKSEDYVRYFSEHGIHLTLGRYGRGTANREMLEYLGIGEREKCILFSFLTMANAKELLQEMGTQAHLQQMGASISFAIPIHSVNSRKALQVLVKDVKEEESEGLDLETENEVIVVITNRGYVEEVMEAARNAGAHGGTVIHARGTGVEQSETFFGSTIGAEKEMIFIVTKTEKRNDIMKAIHAKAGLQTEAQSVLFSLPVSDVAGIMDV